jgi:hypothetical protein
LYRILTELIGVRRNQNRTFDYGIFKALSPLSMDHVNRLIFGHLCRKFRANHRFWNGMSGLAKVFRTMDSTNRRGTTPIQLFGYFPREAGKKSRKIL